MPQALLVLLRLQAVWAKATDPTRTREEEHAPTRFMTPFRLSFILSVSLESAELSLVPIPDQAATILPLFLQETKKKSRNSFFPRTRCTCSFFPIGLRPNVEPETCVLLLFGKKKEKKMLFISLIFSKVGFLKHIQDCFAQGLSEQTQCSDAT